MMTLEDLKEEWKKDGRINREHIRSELERVFVLIGKYSGFLADERSILFKIEKRYRKARVPIARYISGAMDDKERQELDLPPYGRVPKNKDDLDMIVESFLENHPSTEKIADLLAEQKIKVRLLEDYVNVLNYQRVPALKTLVQLELAGYEE